MHIADGVLSLPVVTASAVGAGAIIYKAIKGVKEEEIPKISLLTGAFFVFSLVHIPLGPTSVHPLLGGMLGIILGKRAPVAIILGLVLQALLFQHGGITTLGANFLLVAVPSLLAATIFQKLARIPVFWRGGLVGGLAVVLSLVLLIGFLLISDQRYGEGFFSMVNILTLSYLPLIFIEGALTGFAVGLIHRSRPRMLGM